MDVGHLEVGPMLQHIQQIASGGYYKHYARDKRPPPSRKSATQAHTKPIRSRSVLFMEFKLY